MSGILVGAVFNETNNTGQLQTLLNAMFSAEPELVEESGRQGKISCYQLPSIKYFGSVLVKASQDSPPQKCAKLFPPFFAHF